MRIWLKITFSLGFFILYASSRGGSMWMCIQFIHLDVNAQGFLHDGMGLTQVLIVLGRVHKVLEWELITASSQYIIHYIAKIHVRINILSFFNLNMSVGYTPGRQKRQTTNLTGGKAIHTQSQRRTQALAVPQHLHVDIVFVFIIA